MLSTNSTTDADATREITVATGATDAAGAVPVMGDLVDRPEPTGGHADHTFKILVTGPFAAGKTSLIQSVSQTPVVSTDVVTSGDESDVKGETTVAMDFGTYQLPEESIRLLLFGTPGQPRFRFMTNILKGEVDVVAFVIDAQARHTHAAAGVELRSLLADIRVPAVVAVNRCDDVLDAQRVARSLGALAGESVVPCQLVDPSSGRDVVIEILLTLLDSLEQTALDPAAPLQSKVV